MDRICHSKERAAKGSQQIPPVDPATRDHEVQKVVEKANETLETFGTTSLRFSYDHERQLVVVQVVRAADGPGQREEVIRQIPPEDLLDLVERLDELQGVLFDGQA
jgi:flagellar protein FlaG